MIGVLKISPKGIVAKCGFKYLRFEPDSMEFLLENERIQYKERVLEFNGNKIFVNFTEDDIHKESMSAVIVENANILNKTSNTGEVFEDRGRRTVVLDTDFNLCPVVYRTTSGATPKRNDIQKYSEFNFIKFQSEWENGKEVLSIETSLDSPNEETLWAQFQKIHPEIFGMVSMTEIGASNLDVELVNQIAENRAHLSRFRTKYGPIFKMNFNIDLESFDMMDVIDLVNIDEINIDEESHLKTYPTFEISTSTAVLKGRGLTEELHEELEPNKYYYMLVDNCFYHRINAGEKTSLVINTTDPKTGKKPDFLFLKFNAAGLRKCMSDLTIKKLLA